MEDLIIDILQYFGYPVIQQGSMVKEEQYPESFFTFWNNQSTTGSSYNNKAATTIWNYDINFYGTDPVLVNSKLLEAKEELLKAGFIIDGKGYGVASDEPTHTGRGINALFLEREVLKK